MNIQQFAIGTLAAITTADLTREVAIQPGVSSPIVPPQTPEFVSGTPLTQNPKDNLRGMQGADILNTDAAGGKNVAASTPALVEQVQFIDLQDHWARGFIEALQARGLLHGFPDRSFRPETPMTQGQFAAVLQQAFPNRRQASAQKLGGASFANLEDHQWARTAIDAVSHMGFVGEYTTEGFQANEPISRLQVLLALVHGLNLTIPESARRDLEAYFQEVESIPQEAKQRLATAIVFLHQLDRHPTLPQDSHLEDWVVHLNQLATRAEVAACIYQALEIAQSTRSQAPFSPEAIAPPDESDFSAGNAPAEEQSSPSPTPTAEMNPSSSPDSPASGLSAQLSDVSAESVSFSDKPSPFWIGGGETLSTDEDAVSDGAMVRNPGASVPLNADRRFSNPKPSTRDWSGADNSVTPSAPSTPTSRLETRGNDHSREERYGRSPDMGAARVSHLQRSDAVWERRDRFNPPPPKQAPPSPINSAHQESESLETRISTRLDLLRERIQTTNTTPQALPPLAAAGTYLPEPLQGFQQLIWPTHGVFTSGYGMRWGRMHKGIDIAAPIGTPIVSVARGTVTYARWNPGGYGNLVEIEHPDGSFTRYAHNHRILVVEGQAVEQGQVIAEVGSTGNSTGPHLHFEFYPPGEDAVDPLVYLPGDPANLRINSTVGQSIP
ncbi:peptidoglycan DD-metalloendopeptidase family protein [Phormidium sp. CCY1219]|uniref:peptidoglycan DD-metalloendopeptidase family protein n=1 Tax=Phormidium sp. CCY1219 TaxID=2886104 RepID=UPI002D1E6F6B|nr:peptidoglycan DD-metalloendopeptidase family protein [Phormidium sp. CCY1219]MEB3831319.1 peptidoglycan DD-metalloendopeptidase family protein [Phormidium sp. CCY1219]